MNRRNVTFIFVAVITIICSGVTGIVGGFLGTRLGNDNLSNAFGNITNQNVQVVNEDSAIIDVAEKAGDAVVSVIITKDVPKYENYYYNPFEDSYLEDYGFQQQGRRQVGTEERQVGAGTGFVISSDGLIITNRHVVDDEDASYTVFFPDEKTYEAKVLARDTLLDIAFLKIDGVSDLPKIDLGSSENLKVGQRVIAIGNALGEFDNTVSTGIISGLSRDIVASGSSGQGSELLNDVIQTDASINFGNSGGPLLDVNGNVIGVNVAVANEAENIGFAIPINVVKDLIERLDTQGNIDRPLLGVRFVSIDATVKEKNKLTVDSGALIARGTGQDEPAVLPGSPADKAGLRENDIILEVNGEKIDDTNPLPNLIQKYKIDDEVTLKIQRQGSEQEVKVKLEKF